MPGRVEIDNVQPVVSCGTYPAKAVVGEVVPVSAAVWREGHEAVAATLVVRYLGPRYPQVTEIRRIKAVEAPERLASAPETRERVKPLLLPMTVGQEPYVFHGQFTPNCVGLWTFRVDGWGDPIHTWRHGLTAKLDAGQGERELSNDLLIGAALVERAATGVPRALRDPLLSAAAALRAPGDPVTRTALALAPQIEELLTAYPLRDIVTRGEQYGVWVDRPLARFSAWYEMFPRSTGGRDADGEPVHGTFSTAAAALGRIAEMGFDVVYFPPIQPIGRVNRKGPNNALAASPDDVGSPWAIGSAEGGHKSILPELGSLEDFKRLNARARELGIEIALDLAFQCAPDHPYVKAHPEWFKHRPDGSVQYAENPPKKYQDIYPFDFETEDWSGLWVELKSIIEYWVEQGIRIFRVDNPHTKPFPFWEWAINEVQRVHPDVLFLAEAFTRPKVMHRLAKAGFTQSYTYFTWRNSKRELTEYFTELAHGPGREYFRPNVWPNTPDILHETLQSGIRAAFASRLILAATLSANYGIYGPTFELMESAPREPGSEEYRDSEKYQLRHWSLDRSDSLRSLIARINRIRRENSALQSNESLRFCTLDNDSLIGYSKSGDASSDVILVVVNLDPHNVQSGWIELDLEDLELDSAKPYQVHDLLSEQRYQWRGARNYVSLDPQRLPAHVFKLRRHVRTEHDFDYFI